MVPYDNNGELLDKTLQGPPRTQKLMNLKAHVKENMHNFLRTFVRIHSVHTFMCNFLLYDQLEDLYC